MEPTPGTASPPADTLEPTTPHPPSPDRLGRPQPGCGRRTHRLGSLRADIRHTAVGVSAFFSSWQLSWSSGRWAPTPTSSSWAAFLTSRRPAADRRPRATVEPGPRPQRNVRAHAARRPIRHRLGRHSAAHCLAAVNPDRPDRALAEPVDHETPV